MMKKMASIEKNGKESSSPYPDPDDNDILRKKFSNVIIDKSGYPVLENDNPFGDKNTRGAGEGTSKLKTKTTTTS